MLYELSKNTEIIIDKPVRKKEAINIKRVVKQRSIFGQVKCCASTSKVNQKV